ncbi:MAG: pilus assembly protein PilX [Clostridiales bacterium]|nr:pilus assembly protein PilX [Clostridiales bacterium]
MRKLNAIISAAIVVIFLIHGVMGGFMLLGIGKGAGQPLAWLGVGLIAVHTVLGAVFSLKSIRASKAGGWRFRQNALFWARRASGICILVFAFFHIDLFGHEAEGTYLLLDFTTAKLALQMLLILSLFTHIFMNIRPLLVSLGIIGGKEKRLDVFVALSLILLFCAGAVLAYYAGWKT